MQSTKIFKLLGVSLLLARGGASTCHRSTAPSFYPKGRRRRSSQRRTPVDTAAYSGLSGLPKEGGYCAMLAADTRGLGTLIGRILLWLESPHAGRSWGVLNSAVLWLARASYPSFRWMARSVCVAALKNPAPLSSAYAEEGNALWCQKVGPPVNALTTLTPLLVPASFLTLKHLWIIASTNQGSSNKICCIIVTCHYNGRYDKKDVKDRTSESNPLLPAPVLPTASPSRSNYQLLSAR
jgi:hypothetical protein